MLELQGRQAAITTRASLVGTDDPSKVAIISYHEVMWQLVGALTEAELVVPPRLITDGGDAAEVRTVVFAVVRNPDGP